MDFRHVRTFVTVAEQGTVSKAATRLRVAQPALSRQIGDLETELGLKLFDRIRKRLVLTGEGEQLLSECRNILSAVDALSERAELLCRGDTGILRIAATPQSLEGVFSTFLHRYAARFPNVQIKLSEAVGRELYEKLESGELHLGISLLQAMLQATQAGKSEFETLPLMQIELLAAGHAGLPLGSRGDIEIGSLASHPLLLLDPSFFVRTTFDAACRLAGAKPEIFMQSRAPHTLLAFAEAGHGVAVVPSVLPTNRYRLNTARITHRRRALRESLVVVWHSRRALPPYARDFCAFLQSYIREAFPVPQRPAAKGARPRNPITGRGS
jgi:DNA-binding transcriptional LysR family regulator